METTEQYAFCIRNCDVATAQSVALLCDGDRNAGAVYAWNINTVRDLTHIRYNADGMPTVHIIWGTDRIYPE